jgi:hypothetical protein
MTRRRAVAIAVASLIVVGTVSALALGGDGGGGGGDDVAGGGRRSITTTTTGDAPSTTAGGGGVQATAASEAVLHRFDDCGNVLDEARQQALARVTPYGLPYPMYSVGGEGGPVMAAPTAGDAAAGTSGGSRSAESSAQATSDAGAAYSGTNLQEAGVDEPDIVKNDGRRAFTLVGRRLRAVLFDGDGSIRAGDSIDLDVPAGAELLQVGQNVVVLSPAGDGISTRVIVVDGRDPQALSILRQIDVEGTYLSARQIGDTVRLVVTQNGPAFDFTYPQSDSEAEKKRALAVNRAAIQRAKLAEWLPDVTFDGTRRLVPAPACDDVYLTKSFAGPGSTSVITLSPAEGKVLDATSVMATATEVYATTNHLYVATSLWRQPVEGDVAPSTGETTEIHRFDISDPRKSVYEASGSVAGHLLRPPWFVPSGPIAQWAMSEHADDLRVATTVMSGTGIDNAVTVLRPTAGALTPIGTLTGLARGEQLYAVRFMGDRGYLVTYKRVDPLFVLDLSNPRAPRAVGELKVPGYSAYLHPIGDGLLLGIGQDDPDEDGLADGTQVSVFDVSDSAHPRRLGQLKLGERGTVAGVESDPRTFTWWARPARAVITLTNWNDPSAFRGAVALEPGRGGIREVGRIPDTEPADGCGMPVPEFRTRVIGDRLVLFSPTGVRSSALDDLQPRSSMAYEDGAASAPCPRPEPQPEPRPQPVQLDQARD